ncbi:MAG: hypothetical protein LBQ54_12675 [Planctomycetaceae bacterium]|nr:hypothetical protein [Planctomycetaceae bacterium]
MLTNIRSGTTPLSEGEPDAVSVSDCGAACHAAARALPLRSNDPFALLTGLGTTFLTEAGWNAVTMRQVRSNVPRWRRGFPDAIQRATLAP